METKRLIPAALILMVFISALMALAILLLSLFITVPAWKGVSIVLLSGVIFVALGVGATALKQRPE